MLCEAFTFLMENIYTMQFEGMVYQKNSGDSYGYKLCSIHSEFVFVFVGQRSKSKGHKIEKLEVAISL